MGYNLNEEYDFSYENLETPDMVLAEICTQLDNITKSFVQGNLRGYEGPIESYDQLSAMASIAASISGVTRVDIQNRLGEIGTGTDIKFEFFLSASQIPDYKYRILFMQYGMTGYPVKVVLEQGIADELNGKEDSEYIYEIDSKEKFESLIVQILNSTKLKRIIQDLITVSMRKLKLLESTETE